MNTSPGGVPQSYDGQVIVCSECLQPQVFEGEQCAGCHSEFGSTAWPYVGMDILKEDMEARGLADVNARLLQIGSQVSIIHVSRAFNMRCTAPWTSWTRCPEMGPACQFCVFFQA